MRLWAGGVVRGEVPMDDLGAQVVVIGSPVHVFRRQRGEADDTNGPQASRHAA